MKPYRIGLYEKAMPDNLSWEDKLRTAGDAGFDFVEISIDESEAKLSRLDMSDAERSGLVRAMEKTGIPIRSMCLSGHRKYPLGSHDIEIRRESLIIMKKAVRLAADLGIRIIQLAGYDVYYEESDEDTRSWFADNLMKAAGMAAAEGVLMGFETMETEFMNTVEKAMHYVDLVGSPYLGVYPDVGNLTNAAVSYGTKVTDDLECGKGHIVAVHLKPTRPGIFRDLYFDDESQHVDFEAVIGKSWELGVRRFVTEMWYLDNPKWKDNILVARETACRILDRQK